jgi:hypothetical protein
MHKIPMRTLYDAHFHRSQAARATEYASIFTPSWRSTPKMAASKIRTRPNRNLAGGFLRSLNPLFTCDYWASKSPTSFGSSLCARNRRSRGLKTERIGESFLFDRVKKLPQGTPNPSLGSEPRYLLEDRAGAKRTVRLTVTDNAARQSFADAGDARQQRRGGRVDVNAHRVDAVLDHRIEGARQFLLGILGGACSKPLALPQRQGGNSFSPIAPRSKGNRAPPFL